MTMQCSTPKTPRSWIPLLAVAMMMTASCSGAAVEDAPPPSQPGGGMTPVGTNPGNTMPGSMNGSGSGSGNASIKFCNGVGKENGSLTMELVMGSVKLSAASGACSPSNSCSTIQSGVARLVFNLDGKEVYAQDVSIEAGQQYVVISTVDKVSQKVGLTGGKLKSGASCAAENPFPSGSSPGSASSPATAGKFCHGLSVGGMQGGIAMELTVGNVKMVAMSGGCSTPKGSACTALPVGMTQAVLAYNGMDVTTKDINIEAGKQYLFDLDLDAAMQPVITSKVLEAGVSCADAGRAGAGPGPGPTPPPPGGMTEVKFCNGLPVMGAGNVATLVLNGQVMLTAKPGQCAPMKGMACSMVPSGMTNFALTLDGTDVGEVDDILPAGAQVLKIVSMAGQVGLNVTAVPAGMMCSAFEPMP